jgi:hypothetical protein
MGVFMNDKDNTADVLMYVKAALQEGKETVHRSLVERLLELYEDQVVPRQEAQLARIRHLVKLTWPADGMSASYFPNTRTDIFGTGGPHFVVGYSSHDVLVVQAHPLALDAAEAALKVLATQPITY